MRSKLLIWIVSLSILVSAILVSLVSLIIDSRAQKSGFDFDPEISGWTVNEIPIGPTEFLEEVTKEILGFSYCKNFEYKNAAQCLEVFISFWDKGTVSEREVAGHVPEICYVRQGLALVDKRQILNEKYNLPMWQLEFSHPSKNLSVAYFHLSNDTVVNHDRAGSPKFASYLKRLFAGELSFKNRQLLVRFSFPCSSPSPESIAQDSNFESILNNILSSYYLSSDEASNR